MDAKKRTLMSSVRMNAPATVPIALPRPPKKLTAAENHCRDGREDAARPSGGCIAGGRRRSELKSPLPQRACRRGHTRSSLRGARACRERAAYSSLPIANIPALRSAVRRSASQSTAIAAT